MAITTEDSLINALGNASQQLIINKASIANQGVGQLFSLWRATGNPGQGAIPGAAATCDNTLLGALPYTNPTGGLSSYLAKLAVLSQYVGSLVIYDRLAHMGGLNGTLTTAQTANVVLPAARDANGSNTGAGVEAFLEWYADTGATAVNATVSYTNQAGTAGQGVTLAVAATTRASRLMPILPLVAGDTGVRSVQSVTLSATTGTAGSFGVTLARRVLELPLAVAYTPQMLDAIQAGLPRVFDGSCLFLTWWSGAGGASPQINGSATLAQG